MGKVITLPVIRIERYDMDCDLALLNSAQSASASIADLEERLAALTAEVKTLRDAFERSAVMKKINAKAKIINRRKSR